MILLPPPTLTVSVDGEGQLRFAQGNALVYARRATLHAANGVLVDASGLPLAPKVAVTGAFRISLDGTITSNGAVAGRIVLARVAGGKATLMNPGEGLAGVIRVSAPVVKATAPKPLSPKPNTVKPIAATTMKAGRIVITVRAESQLEGERILLGGIARIEAPASLCDRLAAIDIGALPPIGATRTIGASYVRALLRGAGLKADAFDLIIPVGATAARNGVTIETQTILDEAQGAAEGYVPNPLRRIAPITVPLGELQLTTSAPAKTIGGAMAVTVTATVDGKVVGTRVVPLVLDPNVPTVRVGDSVRLRLISGGATIELPSKVKVAGRQGSDITVVTSTGSIHTGRLLPNSLVEVRL